MAKSVKSNEVQGKPKKRNFSSYSGAYGQTNKVLSFYQQIFDAVFGNEDFIESSKLQHISMYP